jgi:ComF family protein
VRSTYLQHINHNMSILDLLISAVAPHTCLVCRTEGRLLCVACINKLTPVEPRCYRCRRPSPGALSCLSCRTPLYRVRVSTTYSGSAKTLIWQLKLNGARAAAHLMARRMAALLDEDFAGTLVVSVPTATGRARQRGYDQAKLLARELAKQKRLRYVDCLARSGQTHQHGASRQERLNQLQTAFRVKKRRLIQNTHVILVDDVVTTGATLEAAAVVLLEAGATRVEAIVFARP